MIGVLFRISEVKYAGGNTLLTEPWQRYVEEIQRYLHAHAERTE